MHVTQLNVPALSPHSPSDPSLLRPARLPRMLSITPLCPIFGPVQALSEYRLSENFFLQGVFTVVKFD